MDKQRVTKLVRDNIHVGALVVMVIIPVFLPKNVPPGIFGLGVVGGCAIALQAIGLVLVYRSNRIINFAQVGMGAVAGTLFQQLVFRDQFLKWMRTLCPPCIQRFSPGAKAVNWYISLGVSLMVSILIGFVVYWLVIKRFRDAPRLIVTVATIFLVTALGAIQSQIPERFASENERDAGQILQGGAAKPPFDFTFTINPAQFHAPELLTVLITLLTVAGLVIFFRKSSLGIAINGAAENQSRAQTLGINVDGVTQIVWIVAGLLSGIAAILNTMSVGGGGGGGGAGSASQMVRMLAVAVIAGLSSYPIAVAAAIALGILDQGVFWAFGSRTIVDGLLLVIIVTILLMQRYKTSRAEDEYASAWRNAKEIRPIPRELKPLQVVRKNLRTLAIIGAVIVLGFPWVMSPSQTNLATVTMLYGMVGLSLLVLTGWAGQISLGQFAFAAVGGYIAAVLHGWPFLISILVGAVVGAVTAIVIGIPALKLRGLHLAISTLAFSLATTAILLNPQYLGKFLPSTLDSPKGFGLDFDSQRVFYYFVLIVLALTFMAVLGLRKSRTARALIACRDNERAAQSFGINLVKARLGAFAVSGFLAALSGAIFAFHQHGVKATAYSPEASQERFLWAIIGGMGHIAGPLIGEIFRGFLTIGVFPPIVGLAVSGAGGLFLIYFLPGGLSQVVFAVRDNVLRRIARRYKLIVPSLLADYRVGARGKERAPIAPNERQGTKVYVPDRYRVSGQWALEMAAKELEKENVRG